MALCSCGRELTDDGKCSGCGRDGCTCSQLKIYKAFGTKT